MRSTSVSALLGLASDDRAQIHGRSNSGDDEMERINADRKTADSGSFASGDFVAGLDVRVLVAAVEGGVVSLMGRD